MSGDPGAFKSHLDRTRAMRGYAFKVGDRRPATLRHQIAPKAGDPTEADASTFPRGPGYLKIVWFDTSRIAVVMPGRRRRGPSDREVSIFLIGSAVSEIN